jgi:hypothetical protein
VRTYAVPSAYDLENQGENKMGRPLRKDVNGVDVIGTGATTATGVRVDFYDASLRTDGVIIKQRGAKTFVVAQVGNIGTTSAYVTAKLVSDAPNAYGEMRIQGYVGGNGVDNLKAIAKITKRVATDFDGVRYNWFLENDSSADFIVLTAL